MKNKKNNNDKPRVKFSENDIQKKLYGEEKTKKTLPKIISSIDKDSPIKQTIPTNKHIQEEIDALKDAINQLEDKLKKTEGQKERLKKKLVQRRFTANLKDEILAVISNKIPEKVIILIPVLVIIVLFILLFSLNQEKTSTQEPQAVTQTESRVPERKITTAPVPATPRRENSPVFDSTKKYTLQVAEYSNEPAAERFVNSLRDQGFYVSIDTRYRGEEKTNPYFKINVGKFDSFNEAKKFHEAFKRKTGITDSFIKEKK
ncbi:MAG: SPOR domain-containing protein [PVC group bacterium]|nr:SPOR domain-containing protein [PVC group bacterium]